ncbi:hypothetical protein SAMN02910358_00003 [Lachnospiraceae bacterium XBB1006]|nr:hypothetical protein SAMN02910358_00003 [Lachnospiraceae bacterium XBB1006]
MDQVTVFALDLNEYYSQVSFYREGEKEAISISPYRDSEEYLIPTAVAKEKGISRWYVGQEAVDFGQPIYGFIGKAYRRENVVVEEREVPAMELLVLYVRRLLAYTKSVGVDKERDFFMFCVDHASKIVMETFFLVCEELEIDRSRVWVSDRKESFGYYMMKQEAGLRMYDVLLLEFWEKQMHVFCMKTNKKVTPNVVTVEEWVLSGMEADDDVFYQKLDQILTKEHTYSSVYLVGNGFQGDWMKKSLSRLCTGRRVFMGMNLYTKGACYYGMVKKNRGKDAPAFVYLGGGNILSNVCLKVTHQETEMLATILTAGTHWQDAKGAVEVLLCGDDEVPQLELRIRPMYQGPEKSFYLPLPGLPMSKERTCRVRVVANAISRKEFSVTVLETGFGEMLRGAERSYGFTFSF